MSAMDQLQEAPLVDILSRETVYIHFSLPDTHTLIYDVSHCSLIATAPNRDRTLDAWMGEEYVRLQPIQPQP